MPASAANIVLTGFMGTGKSTVGRIVANRLSMDLVDTDAMIERSHGPIADVFASQGEDAFRRMERRLAAELGHRSGLVISTGGRMMLDPVNAAELEPGSTVVCLTADPRTIVDRLGSEPGVVRPLLEGPEPIARIAGLLEDRRSAYRRFKQIRTDGRTPDQVADDVIRIAVTARPPSHDHGAGSKMFLVGAGIAHSLSPVMWNHLFERAGMATRYGLRDVEEGGLDVVLSEIRDSTVVAANVTMPYKRWAAEVGDVTTVEVDSTGAANFLQRRADLIFAANTDVIGARRLLDRLGPLDDVLVLGAGGTAAALLESLAGRARAVTVVNRTPSVADALVLRFGDAFPTIQSAPFESRNDRVAEADLIVTTVPFVDAAPFDIDALPASTPVYDVMYRQRPTSLQRQLAERGNPTCDGLSHLAAQAMAMLAPLGLDPEWATWLVEGLESETGRLASAWGAPLGTPAP